jgi:hypothetical protein
VLLWCTAAQAAGPDTVVIEGFEGKRLALAPNKDGGTPPAFARSADNPKTGKACLKLTYRNPAAGYGNLRMPIQLSGAEQSIRLWLRKESAAKGAKFHVWLFEEDGDAWLTGIPLADIKTDWHRVELTLNDFRYQPRGDKARDIQSINRMLLGCNFADFVLYVDDIALAGTGLHLARKKMNAPVEATIPVDLKAVASTNVIGIGAEWNPYTWIDVPEDHWTRIARRIHWMRLPAARILMLTKWCLRDGGTYDWDSREMTILSRHLDICQKENITVFLTDWGCERSWVKAPGIKGTDDPAYAEAIGTYTDHLINKKGYTCIKFFILVNEPNNEAGGYPKWRRGVRNVAKAFAARKLDKTVTIAGSDASQCNRTWHRNSVRDVKDVLGAYDLHLYANDSMVKKGGLESHWRGLWQYARHHDPKAKHKPFIVGEAGMQDGAVHPRGNRNIDSAWYALFMADYAVQALRGGSHAVLAWMLDDNSHRDFFWGAWSNSQKGLKLRPWFYTWSLLSRYLPPGSTVYRPKQPSRSVRILAARAPRRNGKSGGWTFCVVNRGHRAATLTLSVPRGGTANLKHYVYTGESAKKDKDGFPVPVNTVQANLTKGVPLECPPESVVVLTSVTR